MSSEQEIREEVEKLGRLTKEQEVVLYNIALRQDELGRQPTNMLLEKVLGSPIYQPLLDREYLTYDLYNNGGPSSHQIAGLIVTLKGLRYCIMFADEIEPNRRWDVAGNIRW